MSLKEFILSKIFLKNLGIAFLIAFTGIMILLIWMNFYTRHGQARAVPDFVGLTVEQSTKLARKSKLRYQIIDSIYTTTVPRGCIAEQNPKPGFKVKKWRNITLTINAFHPEMVAMPNLVNLPLRQATAMVESTGLEVGQLRYKPDLSINVVIEQLYDGKNIREGDSLQKGSVVDLILGKGLSNQRTSVPNLIGMKLAPARSRILESSLNLATYQYDATIKNATDSINAFVYKQIPESKGDATLKMGDAIYLWLTVDQAKMAADTTTVLTDSIPANPSPDNQN